MLFHVCVVDVDTRPEMVRHCSSVWNVRLEQSRAVERFISIRRETISHLIGVPEVCSCPHIERVGRGFSRETGVQQSRTYVERVQVTTGGG